MISVSVVLCITAWPRTPARQRRVSSWLGAAPSYGSSPLSAARFSTSSSRSPVLVRLPLWPRATEPAAVERNVGCAFSHTLDPVVE